MALQIYNPRFWKMHEIAETMTPEDCYRGWCMADIPDSWKQPTDNPCTLPDLTNDCIESVISAFQTVLAERDD